MEILKNKADLFQTIKGYGRLIFDSPWEDKRSKWIKTKTRLRRQMILSRSGMLVPITVKYK